MNPTASQQKPQPRIDSELTPIAERVKLVQLTSKSPVSDKFVANGNFGLWFTDDLDLTRSDRVNPLLERIVLTLKRLRVPTENVTEIFVPQTLVSQAYNNFRNKTQKKFTNANFKRIPYSRSEDHVDLGQATFSRPC